MFRLGGKQSTSIKCEKQAQPSSRSKLPQIHPKAVEDKNPPARTRLRRMGAARPVQLARKPHHKQKRLTPPLLSSTTSLLSTKIIAFELAYPTARGRCRPLCVIQSHFLAKLHREQLRVPWMITQSTLKTGNWELGSFRVRTGLNGCLSSDQMPGLVARAVFTVTAEHQDSRERFD